MVGGLTRDLVSTIRSHFALDWTGIHGATHWARVRVNGLAIAAKNGARTDVVELFAFLHDSCRVQDGYDTGHGSRAADLALSLRGRVFEIDDRGFELLAHACETHSDGLMEGDPTLQACWDADRLDLWRVYIDVDPKRLATSVAREPATFDSAKWRSLAWRDSPRRR
jgi:uncharacterized protein